MYIPSATRYNQMQYRRCGASGINLPAVSLGLWHNFGYVDDFENSRKILHAAFDAGITHFDLANNYGPPYGSAEENFGKIFKQDFVSYRDELFISTKAGYDMWPGPYGNWGSKKYLIASIDQSLKRMGIDYVDLFYHHRPDPNTPLDETMDALAYIIKQGKALYAGISNYDDLQTAQAESILNRLGVHCLINQVKFSMLVRWPEEKLLAKTKNLGVGIIAFSPLAQGLLTDRYLNGIPFDSRAAKKHGYLKKEQITADVLNIITALNKVAVKRGQKLAQMALSWLLRKDNITSVLIGASSVDQLKDNLKAIENITFSQQEDDEIERIIKTIK